jgi:hypothetical protein
MKENILPLSFWAWLTSFNFMSSKCINLPSNHTCMSLCLNPFISSRASWLFHSLTTVNSAAKNIGEHVSLLYYIPSSISLGVGLLDHVAVLLLVFWGVSKLFSIMFVLLLFPPTEYESFFFSEPCQYLLLFMFFLIAILTGMLWNHNMVLIFISFMTRDVQQTFVCFLVIWTSSFEESLFSSFSMSTLVIDFCGD